LLSYLSNFHLHLHVYPLPSWEMRSYTVFLCVGERTLSVNLRPAHLASITTLVAAIQKQAAILGEIQFSLESDMLRIHFACVGTVQIVNQLAIFLGAADLESTDRTSITGVNGTTYMAPNPVNVNRFTPATMMLYCDAI
jgi:hypothetical protein